VCSSAVDRYRH